MKSIHKVGDFVLKNIEALTWLTVILLFAFSPIPSEEHFTICPLKLAGFEHCPGCGLGRSIVLLLHGKVAESISMHPLGIFALGIFAARIVTVFKNYFKYQKQIMTG